MNVNPHTAKSRTPHLVNALHISFIFFMSTSLGSAWSFAQASPTEPRNERIQRALLDSSKGIRRRAVLALALAGGNAKQIVDAVVCDGVVGYSAIRMLPRDSLRCLPPYILNPSTRIKSLDAITVLANAGLARGDWVIPLQSRDNRDDKLQLILPVLERLASSANTPDRQALSVPALDVATWSNDTAAMYRLAAACGDTRSWSIQIVGRRLTNLVSCLDKDRDFSNEALAELNGLVVCLLVATTSGSIEESDIVMLEKCLHAVETHVVSAADTTPLEPAVRWAKWLGCGRRDTDLIEAMRCSGNPEPAFGMRFLSAFNEYLGDCILAPKDVSELIGKAEDTQLDDTVRVGAIRVLAYAGSTEQSVHDLFLKLITSEQEAIRLAAAENIWACVERESQWGRLHAAVVMQLEKEGDSAIRLALRSSEQCLREF